MHFDLDFFAALRRMKDRHAEAAVAAGPDAPPEPPARPPRFIGPAGLALIRRFESCARLRPDGRFEAYPDPGSSLSRTGSGSGAPWTIGWRATGRGIRQGTVWTREQCDARLDTDLARFAREVAHAIGDTPTSQAQFDALVSFHYNTGAIDRATLTKLHKAGKYDAATAEFGKWVHAGGKRLRGLERRRAAEVAIYASG